MELKDNLGSQMAILRKLKNQSLDKLAEKSGVAKSTLQDIEKGKGSTKLDTVEEVAKGLEVDPILLLKEENQALEFQTMYTMMQMLRCFDALPPAKGKKVVKGFIKTLNDLFQTERDGGKE